MNGDRISELSVHAVPSNKKAQTICYTMFAAAAACITVCFFIDKYGGIISTLAVVFIAIAVMLYTRYMAASYIYDITYDNEGTAVFVVRSRTGKKETTLLRVDLYAIENVRRLDKASLKAYKLDTGVLKYNYCPTLLPDSLVLLRVRSHYEKADVFIEVTDEFIDYLGSISAQARSNYFNEE